MLLVPADVFRPRRPDEHFADEARAARDAGLEVVLVDHDLLTGGGDAGAAVARVPHAEAPTTAIYRGWMLRSEQYTALALALTEHQVSLRTSPEQYRRAHELPGWYTDLQDVTPRSVWTTGAGRDDFARACRDLGPGPAVLRDYTKSMKHYWHEAMFIPDLADAEAAWAVAERFLQLRDDDFTGGFVVRSFESFGPAEVRTWWVDGVCRLIGPHPDTPHDLPPAGLNLAAVEPLVAGLRLRFVTVDLRRRVDGVWRVLELGDGQVSDRPRTTQPGDFITVLSDAGVSGEAED
jgi:hypothetical protein